MPMSAGPAEFFFVLPIMFISLLVPIAIIVLLVMIYNKLAQIERLLRGRGPM